MRVSFSGPTRSVCVKATAHDGKTLQSYLWTGFRGTPLDPSGSHGSHATSQAVSTKCMIVSTNTGICVGMTSKELLYSLLIGILRQIEDKDGSARANAAGDAGLSLVLIRIIDHGLEQSLLSDDVSIASDVADAIKAEGIELCMHGDPTPFGVWLVGKSQQRIPLTPVMLRDGRIFEIIDQVSQATKVLPGNLLLVYNGPPAKHDCVSAVIGHRDADLVFAAVALTVPLNPNPPFSSSPPSGSAHSGSRSGSRPAPKPDQLVLFPMDRRREPVPLISAVKNKWMRVYRVPDLDADLQPFMSELLRVMDCADAGEAREVKKARYEESNGALLRHCPAPVSDTEPTPSSRAGAGEPASSLPDIDLTPPGPAPSSDFDPDTDPDSLPPYVPIAAAASADEPTTKRRRIFACDVSESLPPPAPRSYIGTIPATTIALSMIAKAYLSYYVPQMSSTLLQQGARRFDMFAEVGIDESVHAVARTRLLPRLNSLHLRPCPYPTKPGRDGTALGASPLAESISFFSSGAEEPNPEEVRLVKSHDVFYLTDQGAGWLFTVEKAGREVRAVPLVRDGPFGYGSDQRCSTGASSSSSSSSSSLARVESTASGLQKKVFFNTLMAFEVEGKVRADEDAVDAIAAEFSASVLEEGFNRIVESPGQMEPYLAAPDPTGRMSSVHCSMYRALARMLTRL